ncbi:hypothetical protein ACFL6Y_07585 [Elusimicrobiota bacterium]
MKITIRLMIALAVAMVSVASVFVYFQIREEKIGLENALYRQCGILALNLQDKVTPLISGKPKDTLLNIAKKFGNQNRLSGVAIYDWKGEALAVTPDLSPVLQAMPDIALQAVQSGQEKSGFKDVLDKKMYLFASPVKLEGKVSGVVLLFHGADYVHARLSKLWKRNFWILLIQILIVSAITLLIFRWSVTGPISQLGDWMKKLRAGEEVG